AVEPGRRGTALPVVPLPPLDGREQQCFHPARVLHHPAAGPRLDTPCLPIATDLEKRGPTAGACHPVPAPCGCRTGFHARLQFPDRSRYARRGCRLVDPHASHAASSAYQRHAPTPRQTERLATLDRPLPGTFSRPVAPG